MSAVRSIWWAAGSLVAVLVGAFGPWAKTFGLTVDGNDDEIVLVVALVAALALVLFATTRNRRLAVVLLLAGLVSAMVIGHDLKDPAGPFGGPGHNITDPAGPFGGPGDNIHLEWGIWTALAGSLGLALASLALLAETAGVGRRTAPPRKRGEVRRRVRARTRFGALSDDAVLHDFAKRLERDDERGPEFLIRLVEHLDRDTAGALLDQLMPVREPDDAPHRIEPLVSSLETGKRLGSLQKEPFMVEWIERWVKPDDIFYDIGANVGPYSLIAAKVTGNGALVFAFEPSASRFHNLSRNVQLNGCAKSIVPLPLALWSENRLLTFTVHSLSAGALRHLLSRSPRAAKPLAETFVCMRLDDLVDDFGMPVPNHAKINVEGHELEVLRGAEQTLARPEWRSILIELDPEETDRNRAIKALLANAGFDSGRRHERPGERPDVCWSFRRRGLRQDITKPSTVK